MISIQSIKNFCWNCKRRKCFEEKYEGEASNDYKKVSPRPYELNRENYKLIKFVYWFQFSYLIPKEKLMD